MSLQKKQIFVNNNKTNQVEGQGQQLNQNKKINITEVSSQYISVEGSVFDYNMDILKKISNLLEGILDEIKKLKLVWELEQQQKQIQRKEDINKIIREICDQINSINNKITTINPQPDQIQHIQSNKTQENTKQQQYQNQANQTSQSNDSDYKEINKDVEKKNALQKIGNPNCDQFPNEEKCLINHSYIKDFQKDYEIIIKYFLESNMQKDIKQCLNCICQKKIKIKDLKDLSNRNLFEQLLQNQIEYIFQTRNKTQVLRCKNSFCTFKCLVNDKLDQKIRNFYCSLCEENSVVIILNSK